MCRRKRGEAVRNLPPDVLKRIQQEMCRPEGTLEFDYASVVSRQVV